MPWRVKLADGMISTIFKVKPLFRIASKQARSSMIERGLKISVDWKQEIKYLEDNIETLETYYQSMKRSSVEYPEYYEKPFHAYDAGNLCWQAAMEVESAALTVHAPIFTASKEELDRNGDFTLRDNFHKNMLSILAKCDARPKTVLDIGCSTGLSTLKCAESFPEAEIIGIDLSPFMLSGRSHIFMNTIPTITHCRW